jgi:hypothetical protein
MGKIFTHGPTPKRMGKKEIGGHFVKEMVNFFLKNG